VRLCLTNAGAAVGGIDDAANRESVRKRRA
jgi:hypothetical protein